VLAGVGAGMDPGIGAAVGDGAGGAGVADGTGADGAFVPPGAGSAGESDGIGAWFAAPLLQAPAFSVQALIELVVPLAITVLIVQNGQGIAVLSASGHAAPINAITAACGAMSMLTGLVGTVSTCLTGPTNALISSSGERSRHYAAGVVVGLLALAFGLLSPLFTRLLLSTPPAFIATLAGLAMLRVLQASFVTAFKGPFSLGALVAFVVTVAGVPIVNIGAPFWGLVFGFAVSALLEQGDFKASH